MTLSSDKSNKHYRIQIRLKQTRNSEVPYLTKREIEILRYVLWGYTAKKIGRALNISFRTVEAYVDILKYKLQCHSKSELIEAAIRTGLAQQLDIYTLTRDNMSLRQKVS